MRRVERTVLAGDGTRLYARETRGPDATGTPMVCANGIGVGTFFWHYVEDHFAQTRPVICWDYRGHELSEFPRDLDGLTMEAMADDMARVLDAFGHERAIALGHSMGCQVIYEFAHRHPARAAMLVPMLGTIGRPVHTFLDMEAVSLMGFMVGHAIATRIPEAIGRGQRRLMSSQRLRPWVRKLARLSRLVHPERMPSADLDRYLDHFAGFPPLVFFRMAEKMASHTADPYLEAIAAPTLVVAGEWDLFTPRRKSEEAAERIPTAELLMLVEGSHAAIVEQPERIQEEIEAFIARHAIDGVSLPERVRSAG
ncbi:MAG: alpha/beta fold hydrolase [Planctomycetota bacterium]